MRIATLRRQASALFALMRAHRTSPVHDNGWKAKVVPAIAELSHSLRSGLHEGVVGEHEDYWQQVVNKVIKAVAADEYIVRQLAGQKTLFAQVKELSLELTLYAGEPMVKTHNRYALILALCDAMKCVNHPRL